MGAINQMTEEIAGSNLNHMSQMKSFGDSLVVAGEGLLISSAVAAGAANSWLAQGTAKIAFDAGAVLQMLSGSVTLLSWGAIGLGVTLSVYATLIPFITWTASVVNWFVLVIEAVLAAPIWAAAHIHPDGDDAVGRGGEGYMMILSIMMRPALMLFGLITAMLLTQPVTGLVNVAFMSAVSGIQVDSVTGVASFFGFVTVYVIMMTTVLHTVFSLIHWIPDNVPRWIGGHVSGGPASPDQKEKEASHIFAGGIGTAKSVGAAGTQAPTRATRGGAGGTTGNGIRNNAGSASENGIRSSDAQNAEHLPARD